MTSEPEERESPPDESSGRTGGPQSALDDPIFLAGVRKRIALAIDEPSPRVEALMRRLERFGGTDWADRTFERTLGPPSGIVPRSSVHFGALVRASAEEEDADARFLLGCALTAAHAIELGPFPAASELDPELLRLLDERLFVQSTGPEELLDLASELSDEWSELFARGARALRGDHLEADRESESSLAAERVGGYRLLEPLGRGSFGSVYRAIQPELGRQVALKLLHPEVLTTEAERRFLEEGRILSSLSHPGVAILYQAGFDQHLGVRLPFLAMELVRGKSILRDCEDNGLDAHARVRLVASSTRPFWTVKPFWMRRW